MRGPNARQRAAIDAACDRALAAGVAHAGHVFHADDTFLTEVLGLVLGYQTGVLAGTQAIRTKANEVLQLDAAEILDLALVVGQYRQQCYAACWAAKDSLQGDPHG